MAIKKPKYDFDPEGRLAKAITKSANEIQNLTIPLTEIGKSWRKGNVSQFDPARKSRGKYAELSPRYKSLKEKYIGSAYPILRGFLKEKGLPARRSGKLADSMINPSHPDSVSKIINQSGILLGTKVKSKKGFLYPLALEKGNKNMPARPVVLLGSEQVATMDQNKRIDNYIELLADFVIQKSKGFAE